MILWITWFLHSHYFYLLMIFISCAYMCFIDLESRWSCDLHVFHGIYSCFIPYLKDFALVFKYYLKLVFILQLVVIFKLVKLFSKLTFENPYHPRTVGWETMSCMLKLKIYLNMCMKGRESVSYTHLTLPTIYSV